MIFLVTNAIKKKFVLIFQEILKQHPIFEDKVAVLTRFPEVERPKYVVLVRSSSVNAQKLAFDNFVTTSQGYCALANLKGVSGNSIEWVKDDVKNLDKLSPPGFYIVKITSHAENSNEFQFEIDPYLIVYDEVLNIEFMKNTTGAFLKNTPVNPQSEMIYSKKNNFEFKPNLDYTIDYSTGEILFKEDVKQFEPIIAEYQIISETQGPFTTEYYCYDNKAIPGVIIAFGDRLKVGDEQVVFVDKYKRDVAQVYGGRWALELSVNVVSQDSDQSERLTDYLITSLWSEYQTRLTNEGIAITNFSISESEEPEIDLVDEYSFTAGITFTVEADWEVHSPLITTLRRVSIAYGQESFKNDLDYVTQENYETRQYDKRMLNSRHHRGLQLVPSLDSYIINCPATKAYSRKF
jgi:hypothetical protein